MKRRPELDRRTYEEEKAKGMEKLWCLAFVTTLDDVEAARSQSNGK